MFAAYDVGAAWHGGHGVTGHIPTDSLDRRDLADHLCTLCCRLFALSAGRHAYRGGPFWWSYSGTVISTVWMMSVGAIAAAVAGNTFHHGFVRFLRRIWRLAPCDRSYVGRDCARHCRDQRAQSLWRLHVDDDDPHGDFPRSRSTGRCGPVITVTLSSIGTALGIFGQGDFVTNLENLILFLAYFLIPWDRDQPR